MLSHFIAFSLQANPIGSIKGLVALLLLLIDQFGMNQVWNALNVISGADVDDNEGNDSSSGGGGDSASGGGVRVRRGGRDGDEDDNGGAAAGLH